MLHTFISSPYVSGHFTPVLAFSASVHAALFYAAVTSTGVERRTHGPAVAMESVRYTELPVRRMPSRVARPARRAPRTSPDGAEAAKREIPLPTLPPSFDLLLPDPPVMPDFQPDVSVREFDGPTGIADDVLRLGLRSDASRRRDAARYGAFDEATVERRATPARENRLPRYPYQMQSHGIETRFEVTFVIDTTGTIDQETVEWPRAVEQAFTRAVADVLKKWRFAPAEIGGRRVRQRVSQPFQFRLEGRPGY
jgi:protein TonB